MRHAEDDPNLRTQANEASLKPKRNDKRSKIFVNQMNKTFKVNFNCNRKLNLCVSKRKISSIGLVHTSLKSVEVPL